MKRALAFEQGRMRIIKAAVQRMRNEIAQIFFAQLAQCMNDRLRLSHCRTRERVRLIFETARPAINEWCEPENYCPRQQAKEQQGRNDIRGSKACLMLETKRAIEPLLTRQPRDRGEPCKDASDGNAEQFQHMALFIMPNFMREHRFQFRLCQLRHERIEQNDFATTPEPCEEGVRVARAFAAVHQFDAARG